MTDLKALLERLRAATGPDRMLDGDIHNALFGTAYVQSSGSVTGFMTSLANNGNPSVPDYTASIDAALALVERVLPGWMVVNLCEWEADVLRARGPWQCCLKEIGTQDDLRAPKGKADHAPTAPLAILSALLSALIAKDAQP